MHCALLRPGGVTSSGLETGVDSEVTGVGRMPVTYPLLVLHLLSVRAQIMLAKYFDFSLPSALLLDCQEN